MLKEKVSGGFLFLFVCLREREREYDVCCVCCPADPVN